MFTAKQIQKAHSKVKSGADFPSYIQEIKAFGVTRYEAFVSDGHINYYGENDQMAAIPAKYDTIHITTTPDIDFFKAELKAHQQGKTDFLTFIKMCASSGIEKWVIDMDKMTCTYYDKAGSKILEELIPDKSKG